MIYMDYNATTPIFPEVFEEMKPYFLEKWGNPSSSYKFGSSLKSSIETARLQVAELIGANPSEIIFTSCATESNNTAIFSALRASPEKRHLVTSIVEHSSVLNLCQYLEKEGFQITYLPVNYEGFINLADLEKAITDKTAIVSLMWANNETGVLFPIKEIAEICKSRGVLFHCDAVQAVGKVEISMKNMPIDFLSITGHKIHGPKGIGALFVRRKSPFQPFIIGGHQERTRRGGTESVPLIIGIGKAAELSRKYLPQYEHRVKPLRDSLEEGLLNTIPDAELNGHKTKRLANTTNISFHGIESEALLILLDKEGICASSGSACLADSEEPSHVIKAMKPNTTASREMIRFSLGLDSTQETIKTVLSALAKNIDLIRE